jgi:hypothetical protein
MTLSVAIRLGRVSNLPTVWTNALAGTVLAGGEPWTLATLLVAIGLSLLYVSGMYLNDAFDRDIDARERPSRPIPAGLVSANEVFAAGMGWMLAGLAFVLWAGAAASSPTGWRAVLAALALSGAILFYDWRHKNNALSPLVMGLCRVLAYVTAGLAAVASPSATLFLSAVVSLCYLIGLTYIAKQEALDQFGGLWPLLFLAAPVIYGFAGLRQGGVAGGLWLACLLGCILIALFHLARRSKGDIPRAVVSLIAGIALMDGIFLAAVGATSASVVAAACFVLTLALQRLVSGT